VKVGDLVKLSTCVTRRGLSYEDKIGIIISERESLSNPNQWGNDVFSWVTVNFAGEIMRLQPKKLVAINESG